MFPFTSNRSESFFWGVWLFSFINAENLLMFQDIEKPLCYYYLDWFFCYFFSHTIRDAYCHLKEHDVTDGIKGEKYLYLFHFVETMDIKMWKFKMFLWISFLNEILSHQTITCEWYAWDIKLRVFLRLSIKNRPWNASWMATMFIKGISKNS